MAERTGTAVQRTQKSVAITKPESLLERVDKVFNQIRNRAFQMFIGNGRVFVVRVENGKCELWVRRAGGDAGVRHPPRVRYWTVRSSGSMVKTAGSPDCDPISTHVGSFPAPWKVSEMIPIDDAVTIFRLVVHMRRYLELLTEFDMPRYGVRFDDEHCFEFRYCWSVLNSQN